MCTAERTAQDRLLDELTERVNRLSGQVAALSACLVASGELGSLPQPYVCGMAKDMAARKVGNPALHTDPPDIAARQVMLILERSQEGSPVYEARGPQVRLVTIAPELTSRAMAACSD